MDKAPKMKTKEKIQLMAIKLFNESGIQTITSRHIAGEMGISHGNLDYHYKNKEELLLAIYEKMRSDLSDNYSIRKENTSPLEHLHLLLLRLEKFQYQYRFFNLDVLEISRSYPQVNTLLQQTFELRKKQMETLLDEFMAEGYLIPTEPGSMEQIQHIIRIIITFWVSKQEVLTTYKFNEKGQMTRSIWTIIKPYLNDRGKEEQANIIDKYGYAHKESTNEE
ncbi:DNA-binding transcriptional regulator, AcrR family [Algoriphagus aquimarinus]|uniref:DNA-binding transcriptional regulator, AcrR family n=2 Tax=Algoriphagus aquimarinus TaxID=237018 RepID=A0A1I0ZTH1_9BACT|nr:DNA-binding transcriptional regulator, AcrR family [Algoriphagus aquimarinus]